MTISMDKQYRTVEGREVRIYAMDGGGAFPVHGAIKLFDSGWKTSCWTLSGVYFIGDNKNDLIEVKPRIQREYWLNIYEGTDSTALWPSKKRADDQAENNDYRRLACVKIVVDCAEDEGL